MTSRGNQDSWSLEEGPINLSEFGGGSYLSSGSLTVDPLHPLCFPVLNPLFSDQVVSLGRVDRSRFTVDGAERISGVELTWGVKVPRGHQSFRPCFFHHPSNWDLWSPNFYL